MLANSVDKNEQALKAKGEYQAPVLHVLGDVRLATLGGSPGRGDSASPDTQRSIRF